MNPLIYLAGPDVFLPEPDRHAACLKAICRRHGLHAISPLDPLPNEPHQWAGLPEPHRIARRNEAHIRRSQAVIANLTPFRGPGADIGTVYEVGFARALGLPVFAWSATAACHATRARALPGSTATHDVNGLAIEDFGLSENLMVSCAIEQSGGTVRPEPTTPPEPGLTLFERCVAHAAATLRGYSLTRIACDVGSSIGRSGRSERNSA